MHKVFDPLGSFPADSKTLLRELVVGYKVTASLVCDETGSTVSATGNSAGLGNASDLELLVALRRQAQVILTSGATFRADTYKFPKQADLAVLTRTEAEIEVPSGRKLLNLHSGYHAAITELKSQGYERIHVEYGVTGIKELIRSQALDALTISSKQKQGVFALAKQLDIEPAIVALPELYIGLMAWQPLASLGSR